MRSKIVVFAAVARCLVFRLLVALPVLFGALTSTQAATICVNAGDTGGLQNALLTAASNGEDDVIELQSGSYVMGSGFLLYYYPDTEQHDLTIEGGYQDFFGNPCGLAPAAPDASQTVLEGGLLSLTMPDGAGSITLKSITVQNMNGSPQASTPVMIGGIASSSGSIAIYNSMFLGNASTAGPAIFIVAASGVLLIQNSVFGQNSSFSGNNPIRLGSFQAGMGLCAAIVNSTFADNLAAAPAVGLVQSCTGIVANSVFWANSNGDLAIVSPAATVLANDDLSDLNEAAGTQNFAILSVDPQFNADFR